MRTKLLTSNVYSPTNPSSESAIREQIDGSIQEVYDASAKSGETVILTTDQTIAGIKTFASSPIVPTPTLPTQAATKGYVDGVAISATIPLDSLTDDYLSSTAGQIKPRVATLETNTSNFQADYEYDTTPTIVAQEIQVSKLGPSLIAKFYLSSVVTGGAITISTDAGATSIALKNGAGEAVTELEPGLYEVAYVTPFFILRSSGGLGNFFGDGSDGTVANLTSAVTAPNGGTVANLVDASTGTSFVTSSLGAGADVVAFTMDLGKPHYMKAWRLWQASVSTNRTYAIQSSTDGSAWTQRATQAITTTPTDYTISISNISARYWRLVTTAGTAGAITIRNLAINYGTSTPATTDTETSLIMRILEQSTLNGAAIIKQYTDYSIPAKYEHTVENPNQGLVIYSKNNITNAGIIDMSQKAGLAPNGNIIPMLVTDFKTFDPYGIQKFYELTTKLQVLKGGAGGNGGYGGGYSGATGRQTSVGIGGAGRQNLGGFGGGGSGGNVASGFTGGIGGSILNAEIGGGTIFSVAVNNSGGGMSGNSGVNGSGARGACGSTSSAGTYSQTGTCFGGGTGGTGAQNGTLFSSATSDSQYSGGFILLISNGNIINSGTIKSNGGNGSNGSAGVSLGGGGGGGGGAGGGVIALAHKGTYTNTGTVQVNGGTGGTGGAGSSGESGGAGTSGSVGTISTNQL